MTFFINMLTTRQGKILASIVREYTTTAVPVSSSLIAKKYHSEYSSATIRNEMYTLEQEGYILKPHISAGRTPSDQGYRYFVDKLLKIKKLSEYDQKRLRVELLRMKAQNVRLSRTLAKLLSTASRCMAVSGVIEKKEFYDFGMHTLMEDPEFNELGEVSKIFASLDLIDERVEDLLQSMKDNEIKIFIGKENPIKEIQKCSMIIAPYRLKYGQHGIVALIGPKRMRYGHNRNLIDFVRKFFGKREVALVLIVGSNISFII